MKLLKWNGKIKVVVWRNKAKGIHYSNILTAYYNSCDKPLLHNRRGVFVLFHIMECFPDWSNVLTNIDKLCLIFEERVWFQDSPEHFLGDRKNNIFDNPHCLHWLIHLTSEKERRKPTIKYVNQYYYSFSNTSKFKS